MLIYLFLCAYSQFIQEGLQILEKGMKLSTERYQLYRNCPISFNLSCNKQIPSIPIKDQETINFIQLQAQSLLDQLEPESNKHQYYNKNINQLFQEIVIYDQNEDLLSFIFEFSQFYQKKELQQIQQKYYIDISNRSAILMNNNNNSLQEFNTTIFMHIQNFHIPSKNNIINHQFGSVNVLYPPDKFNIRTADKNGSIYFTKPIYLTQFYALSYNLNSIISMNNGNQTIKKVSLPVKNQWVLVMGPIGQLINNITVAKEIHIDSLMIKVQKLQYTKQQIKILVIEKLLERYYELNSESLLDSLKVDENQEDGQQKIVSAADDLYESAVSIFLEFLEKVMFKIQQLKKQKQFDTLTPEQILDLLSDIENEMSQNELLIFQSLFQNFMVKKYSENEIIQMYEKLLQINDGLSDKQIN
ncbi:unnamed protein product [Paramecium sonneborni]|uniref:Uncharacterized protein n=1 Tax=Paramecium sonneborni TaxID=65129 RepID=A0A8S1MS63_9CILI|nr:unnamed protein product [Paramecium sonneborni]